MKQKITEQLFHLVHQVWCERRLWEKERNHGGEKTTSCPKDFVWPFFSSRFLSRHEQWTRGLLVVYVYPGHLISQTNIFTSLVGSKNHNSTTSRHGTNKRYLVGVWIVLYINTYMYFYRMELTIPIEIVFL